MQGRKQQVHLNKPGSLQVLGLWRGCEHYAGEGPIADRRSSNPPKCRSAPAPPAQNSSDSRPAPPALMGLNAREHAAAACPEPLHWVEVPSSGPLPLPANFVCDECPSQGVCPGG